MGVVYLLENLRFVLNYPKSQLTPFQEIEFLKFVVNSTSMEPEEKMKKIKSETGKALQSQTVTALMLSRLIGKMNAATQAIHMAPLYYGNLQGCLQEALQETQDYSTPVIITGEAREELGWCEDHFSRSLISHSSTLTDASEIGWGAVCDGVRTGGPWNPQEQQMHINFLELLAAHLAVKCSAKDRSNLTILLKMDSMSALTHQQRRGNNIPTTESPSQSLQ